MKKKFNSYEKLFLANSLMALFLLVCMIYEWAVHKNPPDVTLLRYVLIQSVFSIATLFIYYFARFVEAKEREAAAQERLADIAARQSRGDRVADAAGAEADGQKRTPAENAEPCGREQKDGKK